MISSKILLVDDDEDDRELFALAVKEIDETIGCVMMDDGTAALNYLADETDSLPDYIFLDLRMPGMNGKTILKIIREDLKLTDIPIIIYTTSNDEMDSEQLIKMGATHFTTKPSNPEEIYYILSMILNEQW